MDTSTEGEIWAYTSARGAQSITAGHNPANVHLVSAAKPSDGIEPAHRTVVHLNHHASTHTSPPQHDTTPLAALTLPIVITTTLCCAVLRVRSRRRAPPSRSA